jgi:photosystem II stability/assembly factor-like uncharacterized protein
MEGSPALETQTGDVIYQFAAPAGWGRASKHPCFAAGLAGLSVSHDGGKTWGIAYRSLQLDRALPTLSVAIAPGPGHHLAVFAGYNGGLLRSLDSGETWENIAFPGPPPALVALSVSPSYLGDGLVFAGTLADGVFYSADRGAHWKTGNLGLIDMNVLCLAISPDFGRQPTLFAGTQSGLFCSRNAGRSWREVELPIGYDAVLSLALSPNFGEDGMLWAGTETEGLWCSEDSGGRWRRIGQPALSTSINQIVLGPAGAGPSHTTLLVLHDGGLSTSEDGGAAWHPWQAPALKKEGVTTVLAPYGFGADEPVLVGLESGRVIRVRG